MPFAQEPRTLTEIIHEYTDAVSIAFNYSRPSSFKLHEEMDDYEKLLDNLETTAYDYASEVVFEALSKRDPRLRLRIDTERCDQLLDRFVRHAMDLRRLDDPSLPGWRDEELNQTNPEAFAKEKKQISDTFKQTIDLVTSQVFPGSAKQPD